MFEILKQLVDFLVKAILTYVATPAGQKEFEDIERAIEAAQAQGEAPAQTAPLAGTNVPSEVKTAQGIKEPRARRGGGRV